MVPTFLNMTFTFLCARYFKHGHRPTQTQQPRRTGQTKTDGQSDHRMCERPRARASERTCERIERASATQGGKQGQRCATRREQANGAQEHEAQAARRRAQTSKPAVTPCTPRAPRAPAAPCYEYACEYVSLDAVIFKKTQKTRDRSQNHAHGQDKLILPVRTLALMHDDSDSGGRRKTRRPSACTCSPTARALPLGRHRSQTICS